MGDASETFRTVQEIRLLLQEARRDAGIDVIRDLGVKGLDLAHQMFKESEARQNRQRNQPMPPNPLMDEMNQLSNLRSLTDLAERLYPNIPRLQGVEQVRAMLKKP